MSGEVHVGSYDAVLAEISPETGEILSQTQWGTAEADEVVALAVDPSGGIYALGTTQGPIDGEASIGGLDVFLARFDESWNLEWVRRFGTVSDDVAADLALDIYGNPHAVLTVLSSEELLCEPGAVHLVRWDTAGEVTLQQEWDSCGVDRAGALVVRPDGQILILGTTSGDLVSENRGGTDIVSITMQP
jgi:hypothetical protein